MTAYWCESAWLTGGFARRVRLVTQDGLIKDVLVGADAEPDDVRLAGVTLPGMANTHSHAFHRALRGRVNGGGGNFWSWREQMYAAAEQLNPDTYFALARAVFAEMVQAGFTVVGEFHYVHHRPGRPALSRPQRHGSRRAPGRRRGGHPAHPARHLLPRGRPQRWRPRRAAPRPATVQRRHRRRLGRAHGGAATRDRPGAPRRGDPLGAGRPPRGPAPGRRSGRVAPAARAPLRAARREPRLPDVLRSHPDRAARRGRSARQQPHEHPRDPPHRARHRAARRHGHRGLHLPDDRARPRRRHRPEPGPARRRQPDLARLRPERHHRPLRRAAGHRDARAARHQRARPLLGQRPAPRRLLQRLPGARLVGRRPPLQGGPRRLRHGAHRHRQHGRLGARPDHLLLRRLRRVDRRRGR